MTSCSRGMSEGSGDTGYQGYVLLNDATINKCILCDTKSDGWGWIVIQRRFDGEVNFNRSWAAYREGFGSPESEFWFRKQSDPHADKQSARFFHAISRSTRASSAETLTSLQDIGRATSTDPDIIVPRVILERETTKVLLPKEWFKTLPSEDHAWLSKSIFDEGGKLKSQL
ncbi:ficolin 1 [Elysia marginata]|uniref:Ficolin 1 n=1 Tax=Elysia marginata TaxID=1093978 RepID=A0AAV4ETN8_9GAST|nr:ficolin 1 [Elysia marginata]